MWDELRDPNTTPERLRELATSACDVWRLWVARHPNTPADVLMVMLDDTDGCVPWNLAQNPAARPELIDELVSRRLFLEVVAANKSAPPRVLAQLAREPVIYVRTAAALNPSTLGAALALLAADADAEVRKNVARTATRPNP